MAAPLNRASLEKHTVTMPFTPTLDWSWLQKVEFQQGISGSHKTINLKGTYLSFITSTLGGSLNNRLEFIVKVVEDAHKSCPKDEPLALVSMGSNTLGVECIMGWALLLNGFKKLYFYPIDPGYRFAINGREMSDKEIKKEFTPLSEEFKKQINAIYQEKYNEPLPEDRIKPLSKAQNIEKYFPSNANVVLIECMPPCHLSEFAIKQLEIYQLSSEKMFSGSHYASANHANSVTFLPEDLRNEYEENGGFQLEALPFAEIKDSKNNSKFFVEWGCKIYQNGQYFINFFGSTEYLAYAGLPSDNRFEQIQSELNDLLQRRITQIKGNNPNKKLTQEEQSQTLLAVAKKVASLQPGWTAYYTRDYSVDRAELVSFLSAKAGHHYRKAFSLSSDIHEGYKITESYIT